MSGRDRDGGASADAAPEAPSPGWVGGFTAAPRPAVKRVVAHPPVEALREAGPENAGLPGDWARVQGAVGVADAAQRRDVRDEPCSQQGLEDVPPVGFLLRLDHSPAHAVDEGHQPDERDDRQPIWSGDAREATMDLFDDLSAQVLLRVLWVLLLGGLVDRSCADGGPPVLAREDESRHLELRSGGSERYPFAVDPVGRRTPVLLRETRPERSGGDEVAGLHVGLFPVEEDWVDPTLVWSDPSARGGTLDRETSRGVLRVLLDVSVPAFNLDFVDRHPCDPDDERSGAVGAVDDGVVGGPASEGPVPASRA